MAPHDDSEVNRAAPLPREVPHVLFREMEIRDVESGLRLCRASHWNQQAADWEQFLRLEPHGAMVAERDGHVVGSVATLRYGRDLAWIAMILVDPAERGRGVGMALLQHGLARVAREGVTGLDATPAGQPLYVKLGFVAACRLTRLERVMAPVSLAHAPDPSSGDGDAPRRVAADDWAWMLALDRRACGYDREAMLRWLAERAPEYAWVERSDRGEGFMLGRPGYRFEHLGPVIASDSAVARRLVDRCLADLPSRPVIIDAPDAQPGWHAWLHERGFTPQRPFSRMYRGRPAFPPCAPELFASIGPEFG